MDEETLESLVDDFFKDCLIYDGVFISEDFIDKIKTDEGIKAMLKILNKV